MQKSYFKLFLYCVTCLYNLSWIQTKAQTASRGIGAHVAAGINPSQIDGDRIWGFNLIRFNAGAGVNYGINENWAISLDAYYSGRGARSTKNQDYLRIKMDYLDLPVQVQYHLDNVLTGMWVTFGIMPSYLFRAEIDDFGWGYRELTPYLNRWDLCTTGGMRYRWSNSFDVAIRYAYSAYPINKRPGQLLSPILVYGDWYNNFLTFSILYNFWRPGYK